MTGVPLVDSGLPNAIPYGHRIIVRRPVGASGGTQDRITGRFVPNEGAAQAVLYDGMGDYQDEAVTRFSAANGAREEFADGTVWLPMTPAGMGAIRAIRVGDVVEIVNAYGYTEDAMVARVRELDCRLDVSRVRVDGVADALPVPPLPVQLQSLGGSQLMSPDGSPLILMTA